MTRMDTDIDASYPCGLPAHSTAISFDPDAYNEYVSDFDFTDAEQAEFLEALWVIMVGFVDLGFDIHPVQMAVNIAGTENLARDSDAMLAFNSNSNKITNNRNANGCLGRNAAGADS